MSRTTGKPAVDLVHDVASGELSHLLADAGFDRAVCRQDGGSGTSWVDPDPDPPAGEGRYYLVREENACGDGGWGDARVVTACP